MRRSATATTKGDEILRIEAKWRDRYGSGPRRVRRHGEAGGRRTYPRHASLSVGRPAARRARAHVFLTDALHRFLRQTGVTVFCPMGWDASACPPELRDPARNPSAHLRARERRGHEGTVPVLGRSLRLDEEDDGSHDLRAGVPLPLEPVVLPEAPREGPRDSQEVRRELWCRRASRSSRTNKPKAASAKGAALRSSGADSSSGS